MEASRFFRLARRLPFYEGVIRTRAMLEQQESSGSTTSTYQQSGHQQTKKVPLEALLTEVESNPRSGEKFSFRKEV